MVEQKIDSYIIMNIVNPLKYEYINTPRKKNILFYIVKKFILTTKN